MASESKFEKQSPDLPETVTVNPEQPVQKESEEELKERLLVPLSKKLFETFLALPDEPGEYIPPEEKLKLSRESGTNPESAKRFEENKRSKYRTNALTSPLAAAQELLCLPTAEKIPAAEREALKNRLKTAYADVAAAGKKLITKKEVDEVVGIVKDLQKYLE